MYYVVKIGRKPGIYTTWTEAEKYVTGYSGAKYKSFKTLAEAESWLGADTVTKPNEKDKITKTAKPNNNQEHVNTLLTPEKIIPTITPNIIHDYRKMNIHAILYSILDNTTIHQIYHPESWSEYGGTQYIFTDGSYKKSTNKAGSGIYFGIKYPVSIMLPDGFTNNQAELIGILYALNQVALNIDKNNVSKPVVIVSDSMYSINSVTKWMANWAKNNWQKPNGGAILNTEIIQAIYKLWTQIQQIIKQKNKQKKQGTSITKLKVSFEHQNSHTSAPVNINTREYMLWHGNHMADSLAVQN